MTEPELLAAWRKARDAVDDANATLKARTEELGAIEWSLRQLLENSGRWEVGVSTKCGGVSAAVRDKWRARYEPDRWGDIVKWAADTGNYSVVQRRLGDKAVMELVDAGTPLPDGLWAEADRVIEFRRS